MLPVAMMMTPELLCWPSEAINVQCGISYWSYAYLDYSVWDFDDCCLGCYPLNDDSVAAVLCCVRLAIPEAYFDELMLWAVE